MSFIIFAQLLRIRTAFIYCAIDRRGLLMPSLECIFLLQTHYPKF